MPSLIYLGVAAIFAIYLFSIAPSILWRDTAEFANVAFTLSIAHPAGFPTYSLLVKPLTFIPFGSVAFRSNLASALFSLLSVIILTVTVRLLIRRLCLVAPAADISASSIVATLLFALGPIVWHNAISAEVYMLNTFFIVSLIYFILRWLEGFDPRWLYLCAFFYGLSAGNHATVALFLPGLLAIYLFSRTERNSCEWMRVIFFFLLGVSIYLYLPARSLVNPPYDWGNPQSLKNFLYQITDQKDFISGNVFPEKSATSSFYLAFNHLGLIRGQFSPVGIILILLGTVSALKKEFGLSLFFLWIVLSNHAFFWGWASGDAFLPSYLVLAFFLGIGTCSFLGFARRCGEATASRIRTVVAIGLAGLILLHGVLTFPPVDKRDYYLPSDFSRSPFKSLDPGSVLFTEIQWSHIKYLREIERLREDISVISLSEINHPRAFHYITPERQPNLIIPSVPQSPETVSRFFTELVTQNDRAGRTIFREMTERLDQQVDLVVLPHHDFIWKVSAGKNAKPSAQQVAAYVKRVEDKLLAIGSTRGATYDRDLNLYLDHYVTALGNYLGNHQYHRESVHLLRTYLHIYGPEGMKSVNDKSLSILYNSLGLSELHSGEIESGFKFLDLAIQYDPKNTDPYLNLALWSLEKAPDQFGKILRRARRNGLNPEELCATLADYLRKEGHAVSYKKAESLCEKNGKEIR